MWLAAGSRVRSGRTRRCGSASALRRTSKLSPRGKFACGHLSVFDRTFAVTYALEVIAVLIGLFGVSVSSAPRSGAPARIRRAAPSRHDAARDRRDAGVRRHFGVGAGRWFRTRAGLAHQPDPGACHQPAVVSLEHGHAHAVAGARRTWSARSWLQRVVTAVVSGRGGDEQQGRARGARRLVSV